MTAAKAAHRNLWLQINSWNAKSTFANYDVHKLLLSLGGKRQMEPVQPSRRPEYCGTFAQSMKYFRGAESAIIYADDMKKAANGKRHDKSTRRTKRRFRTRHGLRLPDHSRDCIGSSRRGWCTDRAVFVRLARSLNIPRKEIQMSKPKQQVAQSPGESVFDAKLKKFFDKTQGDPNVAALGDGKFIEILSMLLT